MGSGYEWLLAAHGATGDARKILELGRKLEADGNVHLAATAYDRAFGLQPNSRTVADARQALLDALAVVEHGIRFRYIPGGTFLMGSERGDPDERPVHTVRLNPYWLSDTPVSWEMFCDLSGIQRDQGIPEFYLRTDEEDSLECWEDDSTPADDWYVCGPDEEERWADLHGRPMEEGPGRPPDYQPKPLISLPWWEAVEFCESMSRKDVLYRLPTEAEWEKAARGGLIGARYPWGHLLPADDLCDFDRLDQFSILPMRRFPCNGYGLYDMSGCVWEWISDWYDAAYYAESADADPTGPLKGRERVLRGGSWTDCAGAVTVSFRMSLPSGDSDEYDLATDYAPNIGFRICRVERSAHDCINTRKP